MTFLESMMLPLIIRPVIRTILRDTTTIVTTVTLGQGIFDLGNSMAKKNYQPQDLSIPHSPKK